MQLKSENLTENGGREAGRNRLNFHYGVLCMSPIIYQLQTYDIMPETTCDVMCLFLAFSLSTLV